MEEKIKYLQVGGIFWQIPKWKKNPSNTIHELEEDHWKHFFLCNKPSREEFGCAPKRAFLFLSEHSSLERKLKKEGNDYKSLPD